MKQLIQTEVKKLKFTTGGSLISYKWYFLQLLYISVYILYGKKREMDLAIDAAVNKKVKQQEAARKTQPAVLLTLS